MVNPVVWWFRWLARRLATVGLLDNHRGQRIADLAWPRFLTMVARFSLRASDIAMVGLAVGSAGIVGISFAVVYLALIAETWGAAVVTGYRVRTGTWTVRNLTHRRSPSD